jgi:hypothetical protein
MQPLGPLSRPWIDSAHQSARNGRDLVMSKLTGRPGLTLLGSLGVALLLSGCGNTSQGQAGGAGQGTAAGHSTTGHSTKSPTAHPSSSHSSSGEAGDGTGGSADSGPGQCATSQLDASLGAGDGAAGSIYYQLVLTNTGDQPCRTGGFGGVSFVGGGDGTQIGAAAVREQKDRARTIVLQPGAKATATLQEADPGSYDTATCKPAPVDGLRVYPPNNTESLFVKQHGAVGCENQKVQLLFLRPYQPVA